ncbi:M23 family metallopeptidase, partial [Tersicoccus sp. Bi-70]|uniref:M23 family metallopeptidase n=1 Tax=Tersicoccus sp. Bi-70 TaxID=1897634 RepID=UPI00117D1E20
RQRAAAAAAAAGRALAPAPVESDPASAPSGGFGFIHPVPAGVPVTSPYGLRPVPKGTIDFTGTGTYLHTGQDFGAACRTPLLAPADGEVMFADGAVPTGGNRIVLTHGIIGGNAVSTIYYHLTSFLVHPGQRVTQGQIIGYTGSTGNSTGCHLHFEVMVNGSLVNPAPYL